MANSLRIACAAVALALAFAPAASQAGGSSAGDYDNVIDKRGATVVDFRGNCVRTKWMVESGECGAMSLSREDRTIYFDFDQATLTSQAVEKLDALSAIALGDGAVVSANIVGFADHMGDEGYNMTLSKKRAAAVRDYLQAKGLNSSVVKARAVGEGASNTECSGNRDEQIACLWQDRKVEVELEFKK